MNRPVREIVEELLFAGGVSVTTPEAPAPAQAFTLVQPDGDVILRVTPAFLADLELQRAHHARVDETLVQLSRLRHRLERDRLWLRRIYLALTFGSWGPGAFGVWSLLLGEGGAPALWWTASSAFALGNQLFGDRVRARIGRLLITRALAPKTRPGPG